MMSPEYARGLDLKMGKNAYTIIVAYDISFPLQARRARSGLHLPKIR